MQAYPEREKKQSDIQQTSEYVYSGNMNKYDFFERDVLEMTASSWQKKMFVSKLIVL